MLSPRGAGLFQRAISQAAGSYARSPRRNAANAEEREPHSRTSVVSLLRAARCARARRGRSAARGSSARRGRGAAAPGTPAEILSDVPRPAWAACTTGRSWCATATCCRRRRPLAAFEAGLQPRARDCSARNRDENKLFMLFDDERSRACAACRSGSRTKRRYDRIATTRADVKATGVDEPAQAMARTSDVYAYRFDWDEQAAPALRRFSGRLIGPPTRWICSSCSGLDPRLGQSRVLRPARRPAAQQLSDAMMSYWGEFARNGSPGRAAAPATFRIGSAGTAAQPAFLVLDTEAGGGIRIEHRARLRARHCSRRWSANPGFASLRERCEVYANYAALGRRLQRRALPQVAGGACRDYALASFDPAANAQRRSCRHFLHSSRAVRRGSRAVRCASTARVLAFARRCGCRSRGEEPSADGLLGSSTTFALHPRLPPARGSLLLETLLWYGRPGCDRGRRFRVPMTALASPHVVDAGR
jgi:hypothetical protein